MKLIGTIRDNKETLIGANIFVSDKNGKLLLPTIGTASDYNGKFKLDGLNPNDYITISFIGYKPITVKVSSLGSGLTIGREFVMKPSAVEGEGFVFWGEKEKPKTEEYLPSVARKQSKLNPYMIGGIVLLALVGGFVTYKSIKN